MGAEPWNDLPLCTVITRWDAMVIHWGLEVDDCSALLGEGTGEAVGDPSSYGVATAERRMRLMVTLEPIVTAVFEGDRGRVRAWLHRPNVNLRQRTPLEVMTQSPEWIRWLISALGVAA
jgi:hypothetical protein